MTYNASNVDNPEIATRVISALRECCTACISLTDGNDSGFNFSTMDTDCIGAIVKNYMYRIDTDSDSVDEMLLDVAYMCESCGDKFIELYNDLRGDDDDSEF